MNNATSKQRRIYSMPFAQIYPLYVQKAEKKGRMKEEVDTIIKWLTGYDIQGLAHMTEQGTTLEEFFDQAPHMNPNRKLITGTICGVRVEEIQEPLMQEIRYLDKLIDELAKGKDLGKILREH